MKKYEVKALVPQSAKSNLEFYPDLLQHLLYHRGIETTDNAEKFLNPDYELHTHDPLLLKDMEKAVSRILKGISENQKIVIYSDYDADGTPGAVIFYDFFKKIGFDNFSNYIPNRHTEGFGLHSDAIEEFGKLGVKLLITLDCGIADVAEVSKANKLGIDVIITDHHLVGEKIPKAFAIVNPKQEGCDYPEKMLCGSGVAFKLIQALVKKNGGQWNLKEGWEKWLLDMVGIATLSDMVPLTGENRVFAYYGLKVLRKSPRLGLTRLLEQLKTDKRFLTEDDIGFTITPRINAASRMGVPMDAFKLLSATDAVEADMLATRLNALNDERKGTVAAMVKEVKKIMRERTSENTRVIVIGNPNWRPSLLGLVANSLMHDHACPVFLWGRDEGSALKGSCRSDGSVNVLALMQAAPLGVFSDFGGHALSGGFTVEAEHVHTLPQVLEQAYEKVGKEKEVVELFVDAKITLDEVSWDTYRIIEKLAPFGTGNPKPLFLFEHVEISGLKLFGKEKNHIELTFLNSRDKKIVAISFFNTADSWGRELKVRDKIDLIATLEKSVFRNFPELRLRIVDIINIL